MKTILLVEDNEDGRAIFRTMLEHAAYVVVECVFGRDVLQCVRDEEPDLILMGISLPVTDGWEVTRMLKADGRMRKIPVIAVTVHAFARDRHRAEEIGFAGSLSKPVEPRRVLEAMNSFLVDNRTVP